jgi:hypothetical protein
MLGAHDWLWHRAREIAQDFTCECPLGSEADITARPSNVRLTPNKRAQNWLGLRLLQCFGSSAIFAAIRRASPI